jgi:hypothetical protein
VNALTFGVGGRVFDRIHGAMEIYDYLSNNVFQGPRIDEDVHQAPSATKTCQPGGMIFGAGC